MRRRNSGFSILEIMIALAIVMLVLAAATTFFITTVRQYKIQTKIVESNIEGVLGLELLRQDLESLGFGLPWSNVTVISDAPTSSPLIDSITGGPRAVVSNNNPSTTVTVNGSNYLVIRSTQVGMGSAAGKWTTLQAEGRIRSWGSDEEDLLDNDRVIVLSPTLNHWTLVSPENGISFSTVKNVSSIYAPGDNLTVTNIVYGVDNTPLEFPWNRADYYIDNASLNTSLQVPQRCASNTGVLVKRVVRHVSGKPLTPDLPLLDCAADMQVIYGLDNNADKAVDDWVTDISSSTAETIRTQLLEVRVYILAHVGQRDNSYRNSQNPIPVGFIGPDGSMKGRYFTIANEYLNYRWKVYSIVVKPMSLAN